MASNSFRLQAIRALENIEKLKVELRCPICQDYLQRAFTLSCSHSFCFICISTWEANQIKCPICRQLILRKTPSRVLDSLVAVIESADFDGSNTNSQTNGSEHNLAEGALRIDLTCVLHLETEPKYVLSDGRRVYHGVVNYHRTLEAESEIAPSGSGLSEARIPNTANKATNTQDLLDETDAQTEYNDDEINPRWMSETGSDILDEERYSLASISDDDIDDNMTVEESLTYDSDEVHAEIIYCGDISSVNSDSYFTYYSDVAEFGSSGCDSDSSFERP